MRRGEAEEEPFATFAEETEMARGLLEETWSSALIDIVIKAKSGNAKILLEMLRCHFWQHDIKPGDVIASRSDDGAPKITIIYGDKTQVPSPGAGTPGNQAG